MFENEKIRLRKTSVNDSELYHSWRNNIEVMKTTSPTLDIYTMDETTDFMRFITSQQNAKSYMIESKELNTTVGIISLIHIDYINSNAELIIDIGETKAWGKGIGKSAVQLILEYSFMELNLHKVYLQVFSFNEKAISLYKKLGFIEEGRSRERIYRNGAWCDVISMGILKQDYASPISSIQ